MNNNEENIVRSYGKAMAKAQILDAIVSVALDKMCFVSNADCMLPTIEDDGFIVLMMIKAFFPEEYDFRIAQLKREKDAEAEKAAKVVADHIQRHIDFAVSTQEGE